LSVEKDQNGKWEAKPSTSVLNNTLFNLNSQQSLKIFWIGWPGVSPETKADRIEIEVLLK
jgi:hypothetical protein